MMKCYFYKQKQLSNETQMIIESEEGRGSDGVRKRAKGIRSEGSRNEKRGLFTKIRVWNCWVTGRVKLQTSSLSLSVFSSPTSPTPRHTACPHPTATVTTKHALTHTHNPRERWVQGGGWGILFLHSYPVVSLLAVLSSYGLIKTKLIAVNRTKTICFLKKTKAANWRPCSQMTCILDIT